MDEKSGVGGMVHRFSQVLDLHTVRLQAALNVLLESKNRGEIKTNSQQQSNKEKIVSPSRSLLAQG